MKLYQALTQVTVNAQYLNDSDTYRIETKLKKPLHFSTNQLYQYINTVLRPGSRHDQNNLSFVVDAAFIAENYDFTAFAANNTLFTLEDKVAAARSIVADLNRHVSVNIDDEDRVVELLFVD